MKTVKSVKKIFMNTRLQRSSLTVRIKYSTRKKTEL